MDVLNKSISRSGTMLEKQSLQDDKLLVQTFQDIESNVEVAKAMRNDDSYTSDGIKNCFAHALSIPEVIQVELMTYGVNIYQCSIKEIVSGLKAIGKYDACAVTRKKLWRG